MRHSKWIRFLTLLSALTLMLAACGDGATEETDAPEEPTTTAASEEEPTTTAASEEEPAADEDDLFAQDPADRGLYLVSEFLEEFPEHEQLQEALLEATETDPVPIAVDVDEPIQIALFIPSLEISDAWLRLEGALTGRLDDLGIPHEFTFFQTEPDEHSVQAGHVDTALADPDQFDYAIFAPTEWEGQKDSVSRLSAEITTLAYNVANPFYDLWGTDESPITHVAFDHETGALLLCEWVVEETGGEGTVALLRGVPGFVDNLRSQAFANCIQENSNLEVVTEVFADYDREKGFTGANTMLTSHPDMVMMHSASTAMSIGAIAAMQERDVINDILLNGWGGGSDELAALIAGDLDVVVFRVIDNWGASGAEIIKLHLEGREDEIPGVVSPTMKMIDYRWTEEEIQAETEFAFRYSGELDR